MAATICGQPHKYVSAHGHNNISNNKAEAVAPCKFWGQSYGVIMLSFLTRS